MYKNYEEAKAAALNVIDKIYGGNKMGCCVTETKNSKNGRKTYFGFVFYREDSNGEFIENSDGSYSRFYSLDKDYSKLKTGMVLSSVNAPNLFNEITRIYMENGAKMVEVAQFSNDTEDETVVFFYKDLLFGLMRGTLYVANNWQSRN